MDSESRAATERAQACLLGGAVGDALGAAVEFESWSRIRERFGERGLTDFVEVYGRLGAITDDTQMTLFTAEGLVRASKRFALRGICHPASVIHHAYLRWLYTQGVKPRADVAGRAGWPDGWLVREERLFRQRAPGATCMAALSAVERLGELAENDSKGCGTVMRVAPIGLVRGPDAAFRLGAESSALTHGHPTGSVAGGAFARLIAEVRRRGSLAEAVTATREFVVTQPNADETTQAIDAAVKLAELPGPPIPERVESLGGGWVAEEALSIAIYCALVGSSFEQGVLLAVNHSGDSDSTGSMTGQLLGLRDGLAGIPKRWREGVELRDVIEEIAEDLVIGRKSEVPEPNATARYPGN